MRIEGDNKVIDSLSATNSGRNKTGEAGKFSEYLAQAVECDDAAPDAVAACAEPSSVASPILPAVWFNINDVLETLEDYSTALGDAGHSLKQIEPLVGRLESAAQSLEQELAGLDDENLGELAKQALSQARVEVIKFRRGDYV